MVALGAAICIRPRYGCGLAEANGRAGGRYGDRLPVQKGYGANLEYMRGLGGQLGGHQGKMEVPA